MASAWSRLDVTSSSQLLLAGRPRALPGGHRVCSTARELRRRQGCVVYNSQHATLPARPHANALSVNVPLPVHSHPTLPCTPCAWRQGSEGAQLSVGGTGRPTLAPPCAAASEVITAPPHSSAVPACAGEAIAAPADACMVVAESEEERQACALLRAQLLYPYSTPCQPSPPHLSTSIHQQLESRSKAEFSRDLTLKQLGLPVLSFLVLSSSCQGAADAEQRELLLSLDPAAHKHLLACPVLGLPLGRRRVWHLAQAGNLRHVQQQQQELQMLHSSRGSHATAIATLDLQLPSGPGDLPLGPSESIRLRSTPHHRQSLSGQFTTWLASSAGVQQSGREGPAHCSESGEGKGGYIFNLCVAQVFRRKGVARRLLEHVIAYAREVQGLSCLRMHAECSNAAALTLYSSMGFAVEYEESEQEALALRRPRRVLFSLPL